jgi:hypothetical protein
MNDKTLHFINNKMKTAGQAVVYRYIDEMHKQVLGIKTNLQVDDAGNMSISLANDFASKYVDASFPVELFFYKKGMPYYVTAKGMATQDGTKATNEQLKVDILLHEAEYCELDEPQLNWWQKLKKELHYIQAMW